MLSRFEHVKETLRREVAIINYKIELLENNLREITKANYSDSHYTNETRRKLRIEEYRKDIKDLQELLPYYGKCINDIDINMGE